MGLQITRFQVYLRTTQVADVSLIVASFRRPLTYKLSCPIQKSLGQFVTPSENISVLHLASTQNHIRTESFLINTLGKISQRIYILKLSFWPSSVIDCLPPPDISAINCCI